MAESKSMHPASWRGVPFHVEENGLSGGRRQQAHTFPKRDLPYVEDMGRAPRSFEVRGFVCGEDYISQRDALIEACETDGPGRLVHPTHGNVTVSCMGFSTREGKGLGGMAEFTFTFMESGEALHPTSTLDTQTIVSSRADSAAAASGALLEETVSYSGASFVLESAAAAVRSMAETVASVRTVMAAPASFASAAASIAGLSDAEVAASNLSSVLAPLFTDADPDGLLDHAARAGEMLRLASSFPLPAAPRWATPSRLVEQANLSALAGFASRMSVAELARSASQIVPDSLSAAAELREQVTSAIDTVLDATEDDAVFTAFQSLRAATVRDLAVRAAQAPRVVAVEPRAVENVLALAHRSGLGLDAAEDILARNNIRHPGFPGADTLEVLRG